MIGSTALEPPKNSSDGRVVCKLVLVLPIMIQSTCENQPWNVLKHELQILALSVLRTVVPSKAADVR